MKQLRILTGLHAGVQLLLNRRQYRIASDEDADLQISDWDQAPLILTLDEQGSDVSLALSLTGNDGQPGSPLGRLEDFLPRRFGDIVLCAGPDQAEWPSDVTLMAALMSPPKPAAVPRRSSLGLKAGALVGVVALMGGLVTVLTTQTATSAPVVAASPLERIQTALRRAQVEGLLVRQVDRRVVVEGLLPSTADMARVRTALQPFGEDQLLHRYAAASDIVRQIGDALNRPGLRVAYRGNGVFAIEGQDADPAQLQNDARRVAADIGPLVRRIDVAVAETLPTAKVRVGAMWAGDGLQYVQTADGTKHLSLQTPVEDGEPLPAPGP